MISLLEKLQQFLADISLAINKKLFPLGAMAIALMALPTTVDVCGGLIGHPLASAQELVEFFQVLSVYGCLGYVQCRERHIYVEMFFEKFSLATRHMLRFSLNGVVAIVFCIMSYRLLILSISKFNSNELSLLLSIPVFIFCVFAAFGAFTTLLALLSTSLNGLLELLKLKNRGHAVLGFIILIALASLPVWAGAYPWAMHKTLLGALGMAVLMLLLLLGLPVGYAMLLVGFAGLLLVYPSPRPAMSMMGLNSYTTAANYAYSVVPMFILMGELAARAGISRDLFSAASTWLGHRRGGLATASVAGCAGFAAVSGDSMATAVTMASVALPEMEKKHYDSGFACATLAAGGTLGILIPPSTGFIFYALVTEVSIGRLFMAGIIPGLILAGLFMLWVYIFARRNPSLAPRGESHTWKEKITSLRNVTGMLILIIMVLGGILFGICSPTQGGAFGAFGTLVFAMSLGRMTIKDAYLACVTTAEITAKLLLILIGVSILGNFFAVTRVPFELADFIIGMGTNKYVFLVGVVILYIILGCMVNVIPMILLTLPALFPTVQAIGFDPIWFGVVVVILMEMGQITPPVGINVFAMSSAAPHVPMMAIFHRIVPYFTTMLFMVLLLTIFPAIATWLPEVLFQ